MACGRDHEMGRNSILMRCWTREGLQLPLKQLFALLAGTIWSHD